MVAPSALLLLATALTTQPPPPPPPQIQVLPPQPAQRAVMPPGPIREIHDPGYLMDRVTYEISVCYVRPVAQPDLIVTALRGLYAAADRPVPGDLEARVRKTYDLDQTPIARIAADLSWLPQPLPLNYDIIYRLNIMSQMEREHFLTKAIREVADTPSLQGKDPLVICCRAIAKSLDPHTKVVTAEESRRRSGYEGEGNGLGVEADVKPCGTVVVTAVYPGGPAQQAGLLPGDRLTLVGDEDGDPILSGRILDMLAQSPMATLDPCASRHCGPLTLAWERADGPGGKALVPRRRFNIETVTGISRGDNGWNWTLDGRDNLALVRVASFSRGTAADLQRVVQVLVNSDVRGVVLDLRWCPGGYLDEALDSARLFLDEGPVASIKGRHGETQEYMAMGAAPFAKLPLVVLVNGDTSGGAELVAAALQDHHRAILVGERTLGKGSVQTPLHVDISGVGFNLTSATFHRPSGRELHRFPDSKPTDDWGVRPDINCRISTDMTAVLRRQWLQQTLRPAQSAQKLPLDDLNGDPQLARARGILHRLAADEIRLTGVVWTWWQGLENDTTSP